MRRWLSIRQDLGLQLLLVYLLLLVPFLAGSLAFDQLVGARIRHEAEASDLSLAHAIAQETARTIDDSTRAVSELAQYPAVIEADSRGMAELFEVTLRVRPNVNLVYRLNSDGTMLYHYPPGPISTVGVDFSFRKYFQDAGRSTRAVVSEGRISPTTNQAVATAVMPIRVGTRFRGVVAANIRLESVSETLAAIMTDHQARDGLEILIIDSAGQVIAAPDASLLLQPAGGRLPVGMLEESTPDGKAIVGEDSRRGERLYTAAPISDIGWFVAISRPTSVAFASQLTLHRLTLGAAFVFILVGLVFWVVLARRVIQPIEHLGPVSEAIGLNQSIDPLERQQLERMARHRDQIGQLVRSVFRTEAAIRDRMREQATLLETSTAVVSSLDPQTVLDRILEQVERLLHVQMIAVIARDEDKGVFRIRASRGLSEAFTKQLTIQPYDPSSVTMRALNSREPIQVSDTETDPSYRPQRHRARAEGFRALLGVPFNTQHAPATVLLVYHREPHVFSENEIGLLVSFANQATMALENAALYSRSDMRLQEQTRRLEALIQSLSDGLILSDLSGNVLYANRRIADLTGLSTEQIPGTPVSQVLDLICQRAPRPERVAAEVIDRLRAGSAARIQLSLAVSGKPLYLHLETFDATDDQGESIGRGYYFHDVTAESELDRMRASLVSTVSHELRSPLAAIKGYTSTLLADDVQWDRGSQREFLQVISDEADRLADLVNSLLDLSRIEAGSLRLTLERCDPAEIIERASTRARLEPNNVFRVEIPPGMPPVFADAPRLETVLRNLIENAVKYAGPGATITVEVEAKETEAVFRVTDDGPGIPEDQQQRVFDSFYQIDEGLSRVAGGAGLGLAICKGLVLAHGGRIWVEPRAGGACLAFSIPLRRDHQRVQVADREIASA